MNPVDRHTLVRKLEYLRRQLVALESYRSLSVEDLQHESEKQRALERLLEVSIQSVIDSSRLLVVLENWRTMRDESDPLMILVENDVLPQALAESLFEAKAFRNILVHEYAEIDRKLLLDNLRSCMADLLAFERSMMEFLQRTEG